MLKQYLKTTKQYFVDFYTGKIFDGSDILHLISEFVGSLFCMVTMILFPVIAPFVCLYKVARAKYIARKTLKLLKRGETYRNTALRMWLKDSKKIYPHLKEFDIIEEKYLNDEVKPEEQ